MYIMKTLILRNNIQMSCYKIDKVMCFECYKDIEGNFTSINIYTLDWQVYHVTNQVKKTAEMLYDFYTKEQPTNVIVDFNYSEDYD